jgi:acyl dehydratase
MALEHLEGASYGPIRTTVSAAKVAEYLAATRCAEPERWIEVAPPSYAGAVLFVVAPEFLASDAVAGHTAVLIHADQAFSWRKPLPIGRQIDVTARIDRVRGRGGIDFVTFGAAASTGGETLLESVSTFLLGTPVAGESPEPRSEPAVDRRGGWDPGPALDAARIPATTRSASRLDLVRYAGASGDFNPIHFDHDAAVGAGLSGIVVHGLLMGAWLLDTAASFVPGDRPIDRAKIRFRDPLFPAESASLAGAVRESGAEVDLRLVGSDGERRLVTAVVHLTSPIAPTRE